MKLLASLFLCLSLQAAVGISPTSQNVTTVENGPPNFGFPISITGTGSWSLDNTGEFCPILFNKSSGTAPDTVYVNYYTSPDNKSPGTYTCHFTVGGITFTVNETLQQRVQFPQVDNWKKVADSALSACSNPDANLYYYRSNCTSADTKPGGNFSYPAVGGTQVDTELGGAVTHISTVQHAYSALSPMDITSTYIVTQTGIVDKTGTRIYDVPTCGYGGALWSQTVADELFCLADGATTITKWKLSGSPPTVTNLGTVYTHGKTFSEGGTADLSNDDWAGFFTDDLSQACMIPLRDSVPAAKCYNLTNLSPAVASIDFAMVSAGKDGTGKHYLWINSLPQMRVLSAHDSDANLTLELNGIIAGADTPSSSGDSTATWSKVCGGAGGNPYCINGSHSDVVGALGEQWRFGTSATQIPNYRPLNAGLRASAGGDIQLPEELGGGRQVRRTAHPGAYTAGAQQAPVIVISGYYEGGVAACTIGSITGSNPFTVNCPSHGFTMGEAILIGSVGGMTGVNGRKTVASVVDANNFTVSGVVTGSYTGGIGGATADVVCPQENTLNEIDAVRVDNGHVHRLAKPHTCPYSISFEAGGYWAGTRSAVSPRGDWAIFDSNAGIPNNLGAYIVPTGFDVDRWTKPNQFDRHGNGVYVTQSSLRAIVRLAVPDSGSCTFRYSTNLDMASPTSVTVTGDLSRETTISSLSASTTYYYDASCSNWYYGRGQFTTLPAPAGNGTVWFSAKAPGGATSAIVDYGSTSGLGSSTSSVACTAGQTCMVPVTVTRGTFLYGQIHFSSGVLGPVTSQVVR